MSDPTIVAIEAGIRYGLYTVAFIQLVAVVGFLAYEYQGMPAAKRSLVELLRPRIIRFWVIMSIFNAINCACSSDHYKYLPEVSDLAKCFFQLGYFGGYAVSGVLYLLGVYYRCDPILTGHPWKSKFYNMTMIANVMMVVSSSIMIIAAFAYGTPEKQTFVWTVFPTISGMSLSSLCLAYGYLFMEYFRKSNALGANKPANYDRCRHIAFWGNVSASCLLTGGGMFIVRYGLVNGSVPDFVFSLLYHIFVTSGMISQLMMRKKVIPGQSTTKQETRGPTATVTTKTKDMGADVAQHANPDLESNRKQ